MIKRPGNLVYHDLKIIFNGQEFTKLEIDLEHINKDGRSSYSAEDVAEIIKETLSGNYYLPSDSKEFGEEVCSYYAVKEYYLGELFKIVFCICSDREKNIGVITLHKMGEKL